MENENSKSDIKTDAELEELKKQSASEKKGKHKVSRDHDFTHTHPTHAKHKSFGTDHEPGTI
ncbi:hypothetical protein [Daejeonella oryzae]|uniref:hypothetical protein n=1 Tax=Daejeonella oryzae TaxID=1122943 RepID=UPI00042005F6|nr:hypothetical protein [Daejeonella oryzae]